MKKISRTQLRGTANLITAAMLYGLTGIFLKFVGYELPLFYQNWTRYLVAACIFIWTFRQWEKIQKKDYIWIGLRTIAGVCAFLSFTVSINVMQLGITYFIFYGGSTIGGYALGWALFHERLTALRIACLALAIAGLSLVYGIGVSAHGPLYMGLAFISGICTSFWNTASKKITEYPATQLAFLDIALAIPIYIFLSLITKEPWPLTEVSMVQGASLFLGVIIAATGLLMVNGFRKLDAQIGSLIMLTEIIFVIIYGYLFYREIPTIMTTLGGVCIIIAMILPEIPWRTHRNKTHDNKR